MHSIFVRLAAVAAVVAAFAVASPGFAQEGPVETVKTGCKAELETFCKDVTPGQQRVLACLYAFGDKLSSQCEYALYDAAAQLERAVAVLTFLINECGDDANKVCPKVQMGEGRIVQCLDQNRSQVSNRCVLALQQTGAIE
jgi:hypothetical protein